MTRLATAATQEVKALHAAFVELVTGRSSDLGRCAAALAADFEMVTPEGACLGREAVLAALRTARAGADFRITISAIRPIWDRGDSLLLQYVEQQYRDDRTTWRRSTALFEACAAAPCGVVWRYLHETWMPDAGS
jgi:hypothetical protein